METMNSEQGVLAVLAVQENNSVMSMSDSTHKAPYCSMRVESYMMYQELSDRLKKEKANLTDEKFYKLEKIYMVLPFTQELFAKMVDGVGIDNLLMHEDCFDDLQEGYYLQQKRRKYIENQEKLERYYREIEEMKEYNKQYEKEMR